jgi:type III secretory pathway component EscR
LTTGGHGQSRFSSISALASERATASEVPNVLIEGTIMHRFLILSAFVLSATLIGPVAVQAEENHHEYRYYDHDGHDYHTWNSHEDHAYRVYLQENHREYRDFHRVHHHEQQQYFAWRHRHPDEAIVRVDVR